MVLPSEMHDISLALFFFAKEALTLHLTLNLSEKHSENFTGLRWAQGQGFGRK